MQTTNRVTLGRPAVMLHAAPPFEAPRPPVDDGVIPDLLHPDPLRRIDFEQTKLAIALAFAGGVSGGLFTDALERATVAPSTWEPASFGGDLFLHSFVTLCFKVHVGADERTVSTSHLAKLLSQPPSDPAIVQHRREIVAELADSPQLRAALEQVYTALCRFRSLLEGATGIGKWDANRRRLDILTTVKEIVDAMATGFVAARSGLTRLTAFRTARAGERRVPVARRSPPVRRQPRAAEPRSLRRRRRTPSRFPDPLHS